MSLNIWANGCYRNAEIRDSEINIVSFKSKEQSCKTINDAFDYNYTPHIKTVPNLLKNKPDIKPSKGISRQVSGEIDDYNNGKVAYMATNADNKPIKTNYVTINNRFYKADNPNIQYTGRIDFSDPQKPKFWSPGVYIKARYRGSSCIIEMNDQLLWGTSRNYIEIIIDDTVEYRVQTSGPVNKIKVGEGLNTGDHTLLICKDTEAGIGYLEFMGLYCDSLLPLPPKPDRKIEFIGNSITCGTGIDTEKIPCDEGVWYDQHNAYKSYGPITARKLNAQWHITAVSGIGLIHSCCNMTTTMPVVFDKINLSENKGIWNFSNYIPDVVTICLGQNDGLQDSIAFCNAYVDFIHTIRGYYPDAKIVCLTSPMADSFLTEYLQKCLTMIVNKINSEGDQKVCKYFFSRSFNSGCGSHPGMADHVAIAEELTGFLKSITGW